MKRRNLSVSLICIFLFGCGPKDPLEFPITATSGLAFMQWRARHDDQLGKPLAKELDTALQELRQDLSRRHPGISPDHRTALLHQHIHQKSLRDVLIEGLRLKLARLEDEISAMRAVLVQNRDLVAQDTESRAKLDFITKHQEQQLDAAHEAQAHALNRLAELTGTATTSPQENSPGPRPTIHPQAPNPSA
jgi:hypothetical protein